ncbi:ATP-dependent DNA helicase DDX11 [Cylas formicarius]|uniref:ATP-dependent DNA helicase DDX11 n=1 Tax=Cylas formicarius TaxID=197179 RepID=UPI002958D32A|nr:ATP-dependent DNA helicase DDX11 [Cylas formicarius]
MNNTNCEKLSSPSEFPFPFQPYDIQLKFMQNIYDTVERGNLGIFESPTGTGKSLSIICGVLKWLEDHNHSQMETLSNNIESLELEKAKLAEDSKDWFTSQTRAMEISQKLDLLKCEANKRLEYNKKIEDIRKCGEKNKVKIFKARKANIGKDTEDSGHITELEDNDILLLDELTSQNDNISDDESHNEEEKFTYKPTKILIASRTHSQLSQFIGEIKKSPFAQRVRITSLASRQNYCINPCVRQLKNMSLINEKCLDLQKKTSKMSKIDDSERKTLKKQKLSNCQCPYFKCAAIEELRDWSLTGVHDIEDLVQAGKELKACPYYASRKAAEDSEIVLMPYNTLLHKPTREASGIDLKNNVVIIDEAHNLLEALTQMHSSDLTYLQLYHSLNQLKNYKQKYCTLFSAASLLKINQLIFVVNKLYQMLEKEVKEDVTEISTLENFVFTAGVGNYNIFDLIKFCKESRLSQKIRSYIIKYPINEEIAKNKSKKGITNFLQSIENKKCSINQQKKLVDPVPNLVGTPLIHVISFLESLTYSCHDGRILLSIRRNKQENRMQFLLLNPASLISDFIRDARSVIVAGGTMKPNSEFRDQLFINAGAQSNRIVEFSCDHIIPANNILPIILTNGANQEDLLFNYTNRMSMGPALQDILLQACKFVKGGIVVFFPSYMYENWVWEQMKNLNFRRPLFREPQNAEQVESVLDKYARTIKKSTSGAIMFSVVGGKLSEGLNFSDDLGRCIIVVGLPYANIMAADLKEKMLYLDKQQGQGAGQDFYENLCMKSVNQCIGRSVRHINDYATVLLLDHRYNKPTKKNALPDWIKRSLKVCNFQEAFANIGKFFTAKTQAI